MPHKCSNHPQTGWISFSTAIRKAEVRISPSIVSIIKAIIRSMKHEATYKAKTTTRRLRWVHTKRYADPLSGSLRACAWNYPCSRRAFAVPLTWEFQNRILLHGRTFAPQITRLVGTCISCLLKEPPVSVSPRRRAQREDISFAWLSREWNSGVSLMLWSWRDIAGVVTGPDWKLGPKIISIIQIRSRPLAHIQLCRDGSWILTFRVNKCVFMQANIACPSDPVLESCCR